VRPGLAVTDKSAEVLIVELARMGDRDAFAELVSRHQAWIRNLMRRCCNNNTLADDLAQQVFFQAWRDIPKLRAPHSFVGWLRRIAMNVWFTHARKDDVLRDSNAAELQEHLTSNHANLGMDLDRALQQLNDDVRTCVVLSYTEGLTHSEIAHAVNLPIGTVKSHIRRGALKLKSLLAIYQDETTEEIT